MKKLYLYQFFIAILLFSVSASAQKRVFADIAQSGINTANGKRVIIPKSFRTLELNTPELKTFLSSLPSEASVRNNHRQAPVMELPMPDGSTARFHVWESSIMEEGLMNKYPEIRTYAGQGIDDPYATIRFDYNPYFGFSAQVLSAATGRIYIDPLSLIHI